MAFSLYLQSIANAGDPETKVDFEARAAHEASETLEKSDLFQWLSQDEIARARRLRVGQREFVAAHQLVRGALTLFCAGISIVNPKVTNGCSVISLEQSLPERWRNVKDDVEKAVSQGSTLNPQSWNFERAPLGRPYLVNESFEYLRVSVSHTQGLVGCLISDNQNTGLDIEPSSRQVSKTVAQDSFSQVECKQFSSFIQIWTLKEAYLKMLGIGLRGAMNQISFENDNGHIKLLMPKGLDCQVYSFKWPTLNQSYQVSLCLS